MFSDLFIDADTGNRKSSSAAFATTLRTNVSHNGYLEEEMNHSDIFFISFVKVILLIAVKS